MLKNNDIVVFISKTYTDELIFEKEYVIDEVLPISGLITIYDESNEISAYHISNFITLNEFKIKQRGKKINKLIL